MNKVKETISAVTEQIAEVKFVVTCRATSHGFGTAVPSSVDGLAKETLNEKIIAQVRETAVAATIKKIDPSVLDEALSGMKYPDEVKAWAAATLWFACVPTRESNAELAEAWVVFYRKWDEKYVHGGDVADRNAVLFDLGLTKQWVNTLTPTRKTLATKLKAVG